jgi:hypothetical protein
MHPTAESLEFFDPSQGQQAIKSLGADHILPPVAVHDPNHHDLTSEMSLSIQVILN